jgi:hypothetical protein
MGNGSLECYEGAGLSKTGSGKLRIALQILRQLVAKEPGRCNHPIGLTESLQSKLAQAGAHGIAHE